MQKNVASQKVIVFAFNATTNAPVTGDAANISAYISKDFGAVTQLTDTSATEMDATNAKGYYLFDAAQAETNADVILVSGKSSTANVVVVGAPATIFTTPPNYTLLSIAAITGYVISSDVANAVTASVSAITQPAADVIAGRTWVYSGGPRSLSGPADAIIVAGGITGDSLDGTATSVIADAVWDEAINGHVSVGTTGRALFGASSFPVASENADALLARNIAGGSDGGRTVAEALAAARNKVAFDVPSAGQFTVYATDDVTPLWTGTYTRSGAAVNALTTVDPG